MAVSRVMRYCSCTHVELWIFRGLGFGAEPLPALRGPPGSPCHCLRNCERERERRHTDLIRQAAHEEPQARKHVQEEDTPEKLGMVARKPGSPGSRV